MNSLFNWYMDTLFDYENTPVIVGIMMIGVGVPIVAFIAFSPLLLCLGAFSLLQALI